MKTFSNSMFRAPLLILTCIGLLPIAAAQEGGQVLVFSKTAGFRHASIQSGITAVQALGTEHGFTVTATESSSAFTATGLAAYDAVVFLNTTGDILDESQQAAFEDYIEQGGGFVGIHAAADTEYDWPWYGGLVGAYFASHPPGTPSGTVTVVDRVHPATTHLPKRWDRTDEWYNYRTSPRGSVHVLATLDEQTFTGGTMGGDHPIAWCHAYEGGRSFYTGGGHTSASFSESLYLDHLWGGLAWAAGWVSGNCSATVETSWERTILDGDVSDPMELAVAPDGRVFFVERGGAVKIWDPAQEQTVLAGRVPVTTSFEDGLLGITLDPDFGTTNWAYLYYSPLGAEPIQRISRFTMVGNMLDLSSESILVTVRTNRSEGGHSGGSLAFDSDGLLYIATGDDTDPFESDGYAPLDERPNRSSWDAQQTSGNPFDLRGKILRIRPLADGSIEIPDGNLFPFDGSAGEPSVYAMGVRNPFRLSLDPETNWLYWGDVGPDAGANSAARGPRGYDEFNQARAAGFFGWPYCTADNIPYRDFDFATGVSGAPFDCSAIVNTSANVSQAPVSLPAAQPAWAWYPYASSPEFPDIPDGGGRTAMAGPVVRAGTASGDALPAYFDGSVFVYEWSRNWIIETQLDDAGQPLEFQRFLPSLQLNRPIDLELGPDGAFYMLEWGAGFGGNNPEAAVSRIAYVSGTRAPIASAQASATSGLTPLTVSFTSSGTFHPEGLVIDYAWDLNGDGETDATSPTAEWTYTENGRYIAKLTVTDVNERSATSTVSVFVGNSEPVLMVASPVDGGFFAPGDSLRFEVSAEDAEDGSTAAGTIACDDLVIQPGIGHDDHNHPLEEYSGCTGGFPAPGAHGTDGDNVFLVVEARYVDGGGSGVGSLIGREQTILRPKRLEAEHYTDQSGVTVETARDWGGRENVGSIDHGDWLAFDPVNLQGVDFITYRVASSGPGGTIEARIGSPDGPLVSSARVSPTGGWQTYKDVTVPITDPGGSHTLYLVFQNTQSRTGLLNLNWIRFHGDGAAVPNTVDEGLVADYYTTPDFSGDPITRIDPQISFDWGTGAPIEGAPTSDFSVQWRGMLKVPASGRYRFTTMSDDGARLWIDGELVVDGWDGTGERQASGSASLDEGEVAIQMDYREESRTAGAALLWSGPGILLQTISQDYLLAVPGEPISTESETDAAFQLFAPRPNPSHNVVDLTFLMPQPGPATLEVFDALGRRVQRLLNERTATGPHTVQTDVSVLPSGVYIVRLTTPDGIQTQQLTVVR
ncbi:MAG: ThuA domain-containing protein [Rubricoccaceae bacterium]